MSAPPLAVWSLYPDWSEGVRETLEFLTTVAASPLALEQRRGLRLSPRLYFEYSYLLGHGDRTRFDLLTMRAGGSPCYVPLWHDVEILGRDYNPGSKVFDIDTRWTEFTFTGYCFIGGNHDYEVGEIVAWSDTSITLKDGTVNFWPKGTRIAPVKKCRLEQQPSTTRRSDAVHVARVKFISLEPNRTYATNPLPTFAQQYVLDEDPNEVDDLSYNYERIMSILDNTMGQQYFSDVTARTLQQFAWWCKGRERTYKLRGMFYALDGRRLPLWVPTVYADFEAAAPLGADDFHIDVKRCGFTELGGPYFNREYVLIYARDGLRHYHKIVDSAILGDGKTERLFLDARVGPDLQPDQVRRLSFLVLSRLDTDSLELMHHTATRGMTTVVAVIRSAAGFDGIENTIEVPPTIQGPACVSEFMWYAGSPPIPVGVSGGSFAPRLDKFGNQYIEEQHNTHFDIYNLNGALIASYTTLQVADMIKNWHGGVFVAPPSDSYYSTYACPIRQGNYVMVYLKSSRNTYSFDHWWALCEPSQSGRLTIKGAVYHQNLTGPPYIGGCWVLESHDESSSILYVGYGAIGSTHAALTVLPSISAFLSGTYTGSGWGGGPPCMVPNAVLYPIVNDQLTNGLFMGTGTNESRAFGFRLPGNGREVLFIYFNHTYMDFIAAGSNPTTVPFEIKTNVQPGNPNGAILKIPLGNMSYDSITSTDINTAFKGRPTDGYIIDNVTWGIPFAEEHRYLSDNSAGGKDGFSTQVSTQPRANGNHWVIFVMAGRDDAVAHGSTDEDGVFHPGSPVYARVRVYEYLPASETANLIAAETCILHTDANIPGGLFALSDDFHLIAEIIESDAAGTVVLHGPIFKDTFLRFGLP